MIFVIHSEKPRPRTVVYGGVSVQLSAFRQLRDHSSRLRVMSAQPPTAAEAIASIIGNTGNLTPVLGEPLPVLPPEVVLAVVVLVVTAGLVVSFVVPEVVVTVVVVVVESEVLVVVVPPDSVVSVVVSDSVEVVSLTSVRESSVVAVVAVVLLSSV